MPGRGGTMERVLERMADTLRGQGWTVTEHASACVLPVCVQKRFPMLPPDWLAFLDRFDCCVSPEETVWLFCAEDFRRQEAEGFRWDELERMSLQTADSCGNRDWADAIRQFWDGHLPIALSVGGDYEYYALRMSDGAVVRGSEPELEETEEIAGSFRQFAELIGAGALRL